jgi:hypothetical protein
MIYEALAQEFGLEVPDVVSQEELLKALEQRLDVLMGSQPIRLVQILYRMDVDEIAAAEAMDNANAAAALARLIIQRTQLKVATRAAFRPPPLADDDADLAL